MSEISLIDKEIMSPVRIVFDVNSTDYDETEVHSTFNKKYHDAARFWKARPYFAKNYGITSTKLTIIRTVLLIPSAIDFMVSLNTN